MPEPAESLCCVSCGYDLAGLGEAVVCPECGAPVERSRRAGVWALDDSRLRRLGIGATLLCAALLGVPLVGCEGVVAAAGDPGGGAVWLMVATLVAVLAAWCVGWLLVAIPLRARAGAGAVPPMLLRLFGASGLLGLLCAIGAGMFESRMLVALAMVLLPGGCGLAWPAGFGALRRLGEESREPALGREARVARDSFVLLLVLLVVAAVCGVNGFAGAIGFVGLMAGAGVVWIWAHGFTVVVRLDRLAARVLRARGAE